jgi:hypothetical protein
MGWPSDLTVYKLLTDWGSLIGGVFALIAGAVAYFAGTMQAKATREAAQLQIEAMRRSEERELDALRKSLATEMRQLVGRSLGAHTSLRNLVTKTNGPITARMVDSSSRVPAAVIYPGSAPKIGLLGGGDAMDVVIVYSTIEIGREGAAEIMRSRTPDDITPLIVAAVASAFLEACKYARGVLPKLKTGVAFHDDKDRGLIAMIDEAASAWEAIIKSWPKAS